MDSRPPAVMETFVRLLVPPASREHVLGDLSERYASAGQYLADALRALPFVVASRVRRTCNLPLLGFLAFVLWFGVFYGNRQSWIVATIPTLVALVVLILRDAYRTLKPTWPRQAALDVLAVAACVLLSQGVVALVAPHLLLSRVALRVGFPIGCVLLFFLRLQSPSGTLWPAPVARALSLTELMTEVRAVEAVARRALRIEIGAAFVVFVAFMTFTRAAPGLAMKLGCLLSAGGALFVAWFLYRHARANPIPEGLGFEQSVARYRGNLEARRRRARTYVWWYVVPLALGPAVLTITPALRQPDPLPAVGTIVGVFVIVGALLIQMQKSVARKLQLRIDQLASVTEKP